MMNRLNDNYTEEQIEWMREKLILGGKGGSFGSTDTPTYWEAEQIVKVFYSEYPTVKVPTWQL